MECGCSQPYPALRETLARGVVGKGPCSLSAGGLLQEDRWERGPTRLSWSDLSCGAPQNRSPQREVRGNLPPKPAQSLPRGSTAMLGMWAPSQACWCLGRGLRAAS